MMKFQTLIGNSKTWNADAAPDLMAEFQTLIGNSKTGYRRDATLLGG